VKGKIIAKPVVEAGPFQVHAEELVLEVK